jgi:hypothetical protein
MTDGKATSLPPISRGCSMPEGAHPLPDLGDIPEWELEVMKEQYERCQRKGWVSIPEVDLDGKNWSLGFAAKILDVPEKDLRRRVREEKLEPSGVIAIRGYRSQGRHPRAYPAVELIRIAEALADDFPDSPDSA